jgi:HKD family nuclease
MNLINNRTFNNHKELLKESFKVSDNAFIVSPFVSKSFKFFPFDEFCNLKKITLLTTLKPNSIDQVDKVYFINELFNYGCKNNIQIEVLIDNSLHGKIYIFSKNGVFSKAIVTSANFTKNGLVLNNEWGIVIEDKSVIEKIDIDLRNNVVFDTLTDLDISKFLKAIENSSIKSTNNKCNLSLVDNLKIKTNPLNISKKVNYWIKPIGVTGNVIPRNRTYDSKTENLHFSKRFPRAVKEGDIMIAYAVGYQNILSIYRVVSKVEPTNIPNDRFPYYVVGENLTPYYGRDWYKFNITISNQKGDALNAGISKLTPSGKNSYGSLMRGNDKLRVTDVFADFIINRIADINTKISTEENIWE